MEKENFINIPGWMKTTLGLTGNRLMVYAIIYGFSQDGESCFSAGPKYIMDWCGCSRNTARRLLQSLTEEGFIERIDIGKNGQIVQTYRALLTPTKIARVTPPKIGGDPYQNCTGTPTKIDPININNNINKNIKDNNTFLSSLIEIGVSEAIARDWLKVRKNKRATNTQTAFNRIKKEIEKSGYTPDECIRTAVEHSWQGFNAEWMPRRPQRYETMEETLKRLGQR